METNGQKKLSGTDTYALLLVSCKKDKPEPPASGLPGVSGNVYIVCEEI
jgi:hypothetical protein